MASSDTHPRHDPGYPIGSVGSALRLMLLVAEKGHLRVSEAGELLGVARSTAHRLMQMLSAYGLVSQDPSTKMYSPGPELVGLGLRVVHSIGIRTVALPHIGRLSGLTSETVHLMTLEPQGTLLCLDSVEGPRALRVIGRTGSRLPVSKSAAGRAILATWRDDEIDSLLEKIRHLPNEHQDDRVDFDATELRNEIEIARLRGWARQIDESDDGISAIAAPVQATLQRKADFAVCIAMPSSRFERADANQLGAMALECANAIVTDLEAPKAPSRDGFDDRPQITA